MDLSTFRMLGLDITAWAAILALFVGIPSFAWRITRRLWLSRSSRDNAEPDAASPPPDQRPNSSFAAPSTSPVRPRTRVEPLARAPAAVPEVTPNAPDRLIDSVDRLAKAVVIAPVLGAAAIPVVAAIRDRFSDEMLDAAIGESASAAMSAAGDLAVHAVDIGHDAALQVPHGVDGSDIAHGVDGSDVVHGGHHIIGVLGDLLA